MQVYGDHSERANPRERLESIAEQLVLVAAMPPEIARHSRLVGALIEAGQLLQGVADADFQDFGADRRTDATVALTQYLCAIARAVCRSWDSRFTEIGALPLPPRLVEVPNEVELRTPEGFAFYAVYPEAYIEASLRLSLSAPARVIGIRSIGTTLSAVAAAALNAPLPLTLRPHGDPFAREISIAPQLERELLTGEAHYIIVDEGPGQSGSSFGAVADWLQARGVPLERIAFIPSHSGTPGPQASEVHRVRWHAAQREPTDFGADLPRLLSDWAGPAASLRDVSAGEWRRYVFAPEEEWSPAIPLWERRKFLAHAGGEKLLLKFAGLGAIGERKLGIARALHAAGLAPEPVALVHGFLVERWCDGHRLKRDEKPIAKLARYIAARARLFPATGGSGATVTQLFEMAQRNISLGLDDACAARLDRWLPRLDALSRRVVRERTDNKLDRHEWVRLADGRLLKTDALDHHAAHDLVGCQDMAWDVAGAVAEFSLDPNEATVLITTAERASGRHADPELLEFYRLTYAAFRLGQASLGAEICASDAAERARLNGAIRRYATDLQQLLLESSCGETRQDSLVG